MNRVNIWWQATRPFAFPASMIPAILGGMVAVAHARAQLHIVHFVLAAVGAACVHAASNTLNDFLDFRKGVDRMDTEGESRGNIVSGRMTPRAVLIESVILWALSACIALYFVLAIGTVLIPLITLGLLLGAGYTAAPTEFKYRAMGDLSVFLAFGVGITVGSYVVQTGALAWTPAVYGVPMALLIWAILHANNLRDIETDRRAQITTMAMLLGPDRSRILYVILIALSYACLPVFAATKLMAPTALLPWLSIPLAVGTVRRLFASAGSQANGLVTLDMRTAQLQMAFGLLLILGLIGTAVF